MKKIEFSKEAKATIVASIRRYFEAELDQPIGVLLKRNSCSISSRTRSAPIITTRAFVMRMRRF